MRVQDCKLCFQVFLKIFNFIAYQLVFDKLLERFAFIDKNQYNDFVILDLNTLENDKNKNK